MTRSITLSVDAMGGDSAPAMTVAGVDLALEMLPGIRVILFGDEAQIEPLVAGGSSRLRERVEVRHTSHAVASDEKPSVALRNGRESSMRLAINAVKNEEAAGIISAGNTGALMAMAKFVLKTLPGIDRPAIATFFPTQRSESVMLDLGANVECDADNLVQFAVMGEVFARKVLGLKQPTIGILNVGAEDLKGNQAVKGAAQVLQQTHLPIHFHGFVEGDDIGAGTVDVIVTDGFTGNVALKTAEGTVKMFGHFLKEALNSTLGSKLGAILARPALNTFKQKVDPRRYNGAMFLGLNGICVKSHGGTDAFGFANAIKVAADLVNNQVNDDIRRDFVNLQAERDEAGDVVQDGGNDSPSDSDTSSETREAINQ
ncbi:MAG: phosphate acyltransferase PlsX [Rhodospirillales bacterium]